MLWVETKSLKCATFAFPRKWVSDKELRNSITAVKGEVGEDATELRG